MRTETERLLLREFVPADWAALRDYQSDPRYLEFYPWKTPSDADALSFVATFIDWASESPRLRVQLAIVLKNEDRLIGAIGLRAETEQPHVARLYFELNPHDWGKGYAQEAVAAMLTLGIEEMKLHRVWSETVAQNSRATIVLERLGFRREGRLRENQWMQNYWWDSLLYGLLASEWLAMLDKGSSRSTARPPMIAEVHDRYSAGSGVAEKPEDSA